MKKAINVLEGVDKELEKTFTRLGMHLDMDDFIDMLDAEETDAEF